MTYSLTWLADVLEDAGLKVAEVPGWRTRGRAEMGTVRGVICHHTATTVPGNMPTLGLIQNGRSDLVGPLAQLALGRDGTYYVVAAGRANHAGAGVWEGITTGNSSFIGIEAENNGVDEQWPAVQMDAYQRGVAAILAKIRAPETMCCGHKEYAPGRKIDPDFDMPAFRRAVRTLLDGKTPPPPIPAKDDAGRPTLRRGCDDDASVALARTALGIGAGPFDADMEAQVRAFQRGHGLVPDGIIGPKTWAALAPSVPPPPDGGAAALAVPPNLPPADDAAHPPRVTDAVALGPDGTIFARCVPGGLKTIGITTIAQFLAQKPPQASPSVVRVLAAMSPNEGRMEAINTYDTAHLSFGMLQWTAGARAGAAELPALLALLKTQDAAAFATCFGDFGLDVDAAPGAFKGSFLIGGRRLDAPADKEALRDVVWAYRFWRAGHHPSLRLCEFLFAAQRIRRFLTLTVGGHPLNEWFSSEYATALVLDEHVNLPANVPGTLRTAVATLEPGTDPSAFDDAAEADLVARYLSVRDRTRMTASRQRADAIAAFVRRGQLSAGRRSFIP